MFKKIIKKLGIGGILGVFGLLVAGTAFAAFLFTQTVSAGNNVTSASSSLQITNTAINMNGLTEGGSTNPNPLTIKNTGGYSGDVQLNLTNVVGTLCPALTLTVSGDPNGSVSFNPIASGSADLGTLAPGATLSLSQVVSMASSSSLLGDPCTWNETATFSGN